VLGALVLVAGVYLFHEVRATPARAEGQSEPEHAAVPTPDKPPEVSHDHTPHVDRTAPPPPPIAHTTNTSDPPSVPSDDTDGSAVANPKIEAVMDQANKAYDRSDFEEAKAIAGKVLAKQPGNVRMMRIMVSSACIEGDNPVAQKWYEQLPKPDREQMKVRCDKYGVTFKDPPQ
jgi:hypothetical protein